MNGYDDTSFVTGMTDTDLLNIGVNKSTHRNAIVKAIRLLPDFEIEPCVPVRILLYRYIYIAPLAVHTNQKRFQCERPRLKRKL